jgi:hypothetical protein
VPPARLRVIFRLTPADALAGEDMYTCDWPSSQGQGTVPRSILAALAAESADGGYLIFGQYAVTDVTAGAYSISVRALQDMSGPVNYE